MFRDETYSYNTNFSLITLEEFSYFKELNIA